MKKLIFMPLLAITILAGSCAGVSELPFTTIGKQTSPDSGLNPVPGIEVITQSPQSVQGILPVDLSAVQEVDYAKNVVFVVFFGYSGSTVTGIYQFKSLTGNLTIWVHTDIPEAAPSTGLLTYQIVKVAKAQIKRRGSVLVRLLADTKLDKAKVSFAN